MAFLPGAVESSFGDSNDHVDVACLVRCVLRERANQDECLEIWMIFYSLGDIGDHGSLP